MQYRRFFSYLLRALGVRNKTSLLRIVTIRTFIPKGCRFEITVPMEAFRVQQYGDEEKFTRLVLEELRPTDVLYDVGACVGLVTVHAARKDGRVVSNFIVQALKGEDITVYGDGSQTRSFCYADDLIDGLIKLMNSPDDFTGPVNLGNPVEFTILELIVYMPLPLDDPMQRKPDISLAVGILKWNPKTNLEEGLKKTIEYFRDLTK